MLKEYSDKFDENQLIRFYNLVLDKEYVFKFYYEINLILENNENFQEMSIYSKFIEIGLEKLECISNDYFDSNAIFNYLKFYSESFRLRYTG